MDEKGSCIDNISLKLKVVVLGEMLINGFYSLSFKERKRIVIKREIKKGIKLYFVMFIFYF